MIETAFILWVAVGTAGFWEFVDSISRRKTLRIIPEWFFSIVYSMSPILWVTFIQVYFHSLNILVYSIIGVLYMEILYARKSIIWVGFFPIALQFLLFLVVPVWQMQSSYFELLLITEMAAFVLLYFRKSPTWALIIMLLWVLLKPLFQHATDQVKDLIDFMGIFLTLFFYVKDSTRRLKISYERNHDPLTGIQNRMSFMDWMEEKDKNSGAMILFDLDNFKYTNDTFGHSTGDDILREVGRRLREFTSEGTELFRWGGDEFVIWFPAKDNEEILKATVQKLHEDVTRDPFFRKESLSIQGSMGVSFGLKNQDLFQQADEALLRGKRTKKNRVHFYCTVEAARVPHIEMQTESNMKWVSDCLRYIMEYSTKGYILTNLQFAILDVNPVFENLSGYSREALIGKTPRILADPHHQNGMKYPEMFDALRTQNWWSGSFVNRRPNGEIWMAREEVSMIKVENRTVGYWAMVEQNLLVDLEEDLLYAMGRNELQIYFQPKYTKEGKVVGAEALIRWLHPKQGFIPPSQFIPMAESKGLIIPIGNWVMQETCKVAKRLIEMGIRIPLSINVSPVQLTDAAFLSTIVHILRTNDIKPESITIEVTEGVLLKNTDHIIEMMKEMHAIGFQISLDDFGTGYSSLSYLKDLYLDEMKIDQAFIRDIDRDEDSAIILSSILMLAKQLQLSVVAEGVERKEQLEYLQTKGCKIFQGYYFAHPQPTEIFLQKFQPTESSKKNLFVN